MGLVLLASRTRADAHPKPLQDWDSTIEVKKFVEEQHRRAGPIITAARKTRRLALLRFTYLKRFRQTINSIYPFPEFDQFKTLEKIRPLWEARTTL